MVEAPVTSAVLAKVWLESGANAPIAKSVPVAAGAVLDATMMFFPSVLTT